MSFTFIFFLEKYFDNLNAVVPAGLLAKMMQKEVPL